MPADGRSARLIQLATELGPAIERGDIFSAISLQLQITEICDPSSSAPSWDAHILARRFLMRAGAIEGRFATGELRHARNEARQEVEAVKKLLASSIDPVFSASRPPK